MVDVNVTGSSSGDSNDPKFSLIEVFSQILFPKLELLVGAPDAPGDTRPDSPLLPRADWGRYQGYDVVFQGGNAGPHQDARFGSYCSNYCDERANWYWEPQAPQMPYVNNLDLASFPAISKEHSHLLKSAGVKGVASSDQIWSKSKTTFDNLESSIIARGYVLAVRVARKVIKNEGGNAFLRSTKPTDALGSDVRKDFVATPTGIAPRKR